MDFQLLFHYTTLPVFHEMLKSIKNSNFVFYASSILAMNDTQELLYGYDILLKMLEDYEEQNKIPWEQRISSIHDNYTSQSMTFKDQLINALYKQNEIPYIVSFSHEEDSLPLWNMYGGNGVGINLCFWSYKAEVINTDQDIRRINKEDIIIFDDVHIKEVYYDDYPEDILAGVGNIYRHYLDTINQNNGMNEVDINQNKIDYFAIILVLLGARMKSEAYSFEKEARFIEYEKESTKVKYRTNVHGNIVPYIEKEVPIANLKSITIGPCANYPAIKMFLSSMLKQKGLERVPITPSKVPFRVY